MSFPAGCYRSFRGKSSLDATDLQFVLDVFLPEALAFALHVLEGKNFNQALREIWFGIIS